MNNEIATEIWNKIPLYPDYEASNLGRVRSKNRILKLDYSRRYPYAQLTINGRNKAVAVHRLVMYAFKGYSNLDVDHINGNKLDARLENLEYVTSRENNLRKKTTKGYYFDKINNKWKVEIYNNGKRQWIGRFKSESEAKEAYENARKSVIDKNSKGEIL